MYFKYILAETIQRKNIKMNNNYQCKLYKPHCTDGKHLNENESSSLNILLWLPSLSNHFKCILQVGSNILWMLSPVSIYLGISRALPK